ncbi:hypothetical protein BDN72DRAFT_900376 [Pluteus cervinus]|uniref:Uncharacterized protein n=1 Tax=Pluteus cervinus TaxID=181527 RepID=A0ACD3AJF7_9AGAR|nr:hypothetical protein BDN72DRAFT_900376 [Pluteus cervinus]
MRRGFLKEKTLCGPNGGLPTSNAAFSPRSQASETYETAELKDTIATKGHSNHLNLPCTSLKPNPPKEPITQWGQGPICLSLPLRTSSASGRIVGPPNLLCGIRSHFPEFPNPKFVFPKRRYRIGPSSLPTAGLGVFATEDLDLGDVIMVDEPFLSGPRGLETRERLTADGKRDHDYVFRETIEELPETYQRIFWSLHNAKPAYTYTDIGGIIRTNGLSITLRPGDPEFVGLGKDIVRINHSCTPNAIYPWSLHDWCWTVYAVTPIKEGEEVFISYIANDLPRSCRLEELKEKYNMNPCRCPTCSQNSWQIQISDINRFQISSFSPPKWYMDGQYTGKQDPDLNAMIRRPGRNQENLRRLLKESQDWIDLVRKESCWDVQVVGVHGRRLVKGYLALGEEARDKVVEIVKLLQVVVLEHTGKDPGWTEVLIRMEETRWWKAAISSSSE